MNFIKSPFKEKSGKTNSSLSTSALWGDSQHKPRRTMIALEPRLMFDGAAAATAADVTVQDAPPTADQTAQATDAKALLDAAAAVPPAAEAAQPVPPAATAQHEILFVDGRVQDYQAVVAAAAPSAEVVVLDPYRDGVVQIAEALQGRTGIDSIGIVSHGDSGLLLLGDVGLFNGNIDKYTGELQTIGNALTANGDILLYGCDVGAGSGGQAFIDTLAAITGADVAASTNGTGAAALGGDWNLEITTGNIEYSSALDASLLSNYDYLMHTASVNSVAQLKAAIASGIGDNLDDIITLTGNITFASAADAITISVTDGQTMTIVGGGFTLSGGNLARVLNITAGTIDIQNLTITNGFVTGNGANGDATSGGIGKAGGDALGAAIYNAGTLTISGSTITSNKAAGGGGSGGTVSGYGDGGGGGGGFGSTFGGAGGTSHGGVGVVAAPTAASAGTGGNGGNNKAGEVGGGRGGSTSGGAGGAYGSYSSGGSGGTANSGGGLAIGGGGGGTGYNSAGGAGGNAAGGIYNTSAGTITILTSTITNNIGAGGGGGGGGTAGYAFNGGAGGAGIGGIWNAGGTVRMDSGSYTTMATGNTGGGGSGGLAPGASTGAAGSSVSKISTTSGGTTITNYVPSATITSATYDASTNVLAVTGTNMTTGDTIDPTKLTLTGEGGNTYTLTSSSVTASSATAFSISLNAADQINVEGLLNKNLTSSVTSNTTYNLAGAANWDSTASAPADTTGNGITVSNVQTPTITSSTYDAGNGTLAVTGTNLVKASGATNDITANKLTFTGEGGATYTLTDTSNVEITSATAFTIILSATDKAAINQMINKNGTASTSNTTYNLAAADDWNTVITGGDISDATGNGINVSNVAVPAITSSTYDASTGSLVVTGTGFLSKSGATNDIVANKFTFTGEGGATYTLTDTSDVEITSGTAFTITLSATDKAAINQMINKNGTASTSGTTYNLAAAEDWTAGAAAGVTDADLTGNGITVSNVAVPAITSSTYDAATGALVVTGTGFLKLNGATNDIVANKFTFTGEGGATYTLTDTANVEITSGTAFTITLSATDKAVINQMINNNGTASTNGTTYNLAAAEDWTAGADVADIVADLTGNGITASNVPVPAITSSTYDASTGALVVTGIGFLSKSGGANDIVANKLTFTGEGGATYTLTNTANVEITSGTAFTITLSATDKAAVNQMINKNGTTSTSGSTYNLAAAEDWTAGAAAAVTVADLTGNGITASNVAVPAITSSTYDASTGALVVTGTGFLKLNGATNDIVANKFTFTGEGGATYTLTDTANVEITSGTAFTITLSAADKAAINQFVNKNGTASTSATTYNLAAAEDWTAGADAAVTIADLAGNGITASNVAVPAITSSTYDSSTGALVVTGTGFLSKSGGTNDIVANKFTFTGEGGATYTLTDTANVEITSGTAFTITLSATDKAAINQMINKNGTASTSATTYNLAAAEDWTAGAATAVTVADLTGNGIIASNVAVPAITSASYDYNTNILVVTGTGFLSKSGATNDIDLTKLTFTGEGGATYTLTNATGVEITSGTSFSVTLSGADLTNVEALLNKDGTSSVSVTTYNVSAAASWNRGDATNGSDTTNAITVSNYAAPTVTSSTYDASTNVLTVTGTNLVSKSGAANDVAISLLTLTGEGGSYALTSSDVDITNDTTISITLNVADQLVVPGLMNKNGTTSSSATTYNLTAAEDWMAGTAVATVVADLTGNGITVSNVQTPTVTSSTYDSDTGVLTVIGTNLFKKVGANNDIDLTKLIFTGQGAATYTLTNATGVEITSATSFTATLTGADKTGVDALLNKVGTSSNDATTYNLAAAEDWMTGADAAVNIADATNAVTVSIAPKITSATYDTATGSLVVTGTNMQAKAGAANDITAAKLTFTGEGGTTYTLTDSADVELTSTTSFTVSLSATDKATINQIVNKNGTASTGATTYNLAVADDWNVQVTAGDTSDITGNGITASNVAVPTITSSTYNAATGSLVVTGTGFLKLAGATNDIVANKLAFVGEGGATYTLTDTANVEITSGTAFTITLSATDKAAINQIVNKNGTASTSATTYNLAAAEDWAAGAATAVNVADLSGNGITASNVAVPTITSSTYDAVTGSLVVTGTGFLKFNGVSNDIVANKLTFTGEGGTYTLTDSANVEITSGTTFTVTLSPTDKAAINLLLDKNGIASSSGTTYNLAAAEDWTAGADAAVTVADLTGNGILVTVNAPPTSSNGAITINEDTTYTFAAGDFNFNDVDAGNVLTQVQITSLPSTGTLALNGALVTANQAVTKADIDAGKLTFRGAANAFGTPFTTFQFKVYDGTEYSSSAYTETMNITAANDLPTGAVSISGTPVSGTTLTVANSLADIDGLGAISYQWKAGGTDINGATGSSYVLTEAEAGQTISVVARYTDAQGTAESVTSLETAPVAASTTINLSQISGNTDSKPGSDAGPGNNPSTDNNNDSRTDNNNGISDSLRTDNSNSTSDSFSFGNSDSNDNSSNSNSGSSPNQTIVVDMKLSFDSNGNGMSGGTLNIPSSVFAGLNTSGAITITAAQSNGQSLPSWISVNPSTGAVTVKEGAVVTSLITVKITIRDSQGKQVVVLVKVQPHKARHSTESKAQQQNQKQDRQQSDDAEKNLPPAKDKPQGQGRGQNQQGRVEPTDKQLAHVGKPGLTQQLQMVGRKGFEYQRQKLLDSLASLGSNNKDAA